MMFDRKAYDAKYRAEHVERRRELRRAYRQTPKGKADQAAFIKEYHPRWRRTPRGQESLHRYRQSFLGRENTFRYNHSLNYAEAKWRYQNSPKGRETAFQHRSGRL